LIPTPARFGWRRGIMRFQAGKPLGIEGDAYMRTAPWPIQERNLAEVLLDDLLDDREA
jgi:hypothetical protein